MPSSSGAEDAAARPARSRVFAVVNFRLFFALSICFGAGWPVDALQSPSFVRGSDAPLLWNRGVASLRVLSREPCQTQQTHGPPFSSSSPFSFRNENSRPRRECFLKLGWRSAAAFQSVRTAPLRAVEPSAARRSPIGDLFEETAKKTVSSVGDALNSRGAAVNFGFSKLEARAIGAAAPFGFLQSRRALACLAQPSVGDPSEGDSSELLLSTEDVARVCNLSLKTVENVDLFADCQVLQLSMPKEGRNPMSLNTKPSPRRGWLYLEEGKVRGNI